MNKILLATIWNLPIVFEAGWLCYSLISVIIMAFCLLSAVNRRKALHSSLYVLKQQDKNI